MLYSDLNGNWCATEQYQYSIKYCTRNLCMYEFTKTAEQHPWKVEMLKAKLPHSEEDFLLIPKCGVMVETKLGQQKWNKKR